MKNAFVTPFLAPFLWVTLFALLPACAGRQQPTTATLSDVSARELFDRGQRARAVGDTSRAEQYILAAMDHGYPSGAGTAALLEVCIESDRFDTALHYGRRFLHREPHNWKLRYLVATLHVAVGEYERARNELERVIQEQPGWPDAHFLLAKVAWTELERPRLARRGFRTYLELAPEGRHAAEARRYVAARAPRRHGKRAP